MMKRILTMVLALLICIGSALGEMKGPRGGDRDNLQQGIDLIKAKGLGACGSAGSCLSGSKISCLGCNADQFPFQC